MIWIDSRFGFGAVHDSACFWNHRGFLDSGGKNLAYHQFLSGLLEVILLPKCVAVMKCKAHTNKSGPVSVGNAATDAVAKALTVSVTALSQPSSPLAYVAEMQQQANKVERL